MLLAVGSTNSLSNHTLYAFRPLDRLGEYALTQMKDFAKLDDRIVEELEATS
jgi:hypothetical protein